MVPDLFFRSKTPSPVSMTDCMAFSRTSCVRAFRYIARLSPFILGLWAECLHPATLFQRQQGGQGQTAIVGRWCCLFALP